MRTRLLLAAFAALFVSAASHAQAPTGTCKDGTSTTAASKRGACSGHGGVATWNAATTTPTPAVPTTATPTPTQKTIPAATPSSQPSAPSLPPQTRPAPAAQPAQQMQQAQGGGAGQCG